MLRERVIPYHGSVRRGHQSGVICQIHIRHLYRELRSALLTLRVLVRRMLFFFSFYRRLFHPFLASRGIIRDRVRGRPWSPFAPKLAASRIRSNPQRVFCLANRDKPLSFLLCLDDIVFRWSRNRLMHYRYYSVQVHRRDFHSNDAVTKRLRGRRCMCKCMKERSPLGLYISWYPWNVADRIWTPSIDRDIRVFITDGHPSIYNNNARVCLISIAKYILQHAEK